MLVIQQKLTHRLQYRPKDAENKSIFATVTGSVENTRGLSVEETYKRRDIGFKDEMRETRLKHSRSQGIGGPFYVPFTVRLFAMVMVSLCNTAAIAGIVWFFYELVTHTIL